MCRAVLVFFFLGLILNSFGQEPTGLPDPDPQYMTDEYEVIVLDGVKVLRSKITNEVYDTNFRKRGEQPTVVSPMPTTTSTFRTDWMNIYWDTKTFNPYKADGSDKIEWPVTLSFVGERFTMPTEGTITSRYGWRRGRAHKGIDIDLVTGDNVLAAIDGKVRFARYYSGFGNCVVIRHNNGLETIYAHLSKILVQADTYVYSGQVIGKGGNTGRSRGSHLHFEVRWFNNPINPEYFFDFDNTKYLTAQQHVVTKFWADPRKHRSYKKSNIVVRQPSGTLATVTPSQPQTLGQSQPYTKSANQPMQTNSNSDFAKTTTADGFRKSTNTDSFEKPTATEYHVIVRGDTLGKIANRYGTTVSELCQLNGISRSSVIKVGKKLRVR